MKAKIQFFNIKFCGYYIANSDDYAFGGIEEVFDDVATFIKNKNLSQTQTYEPNETHPLRTFCYSLEKKNSEFLLTTWNEIENKDGKVASINTNGFPQNAEINTLECDEFYVPGYPTFFWILPNEGKMATISFDSARNGRENLELYVLNFLKSCSRFCAIEADGTCVGYGDHEAIDSRRILPRFKTQPVKKASKIDVIKDNCQNIVKLIRKDNISCSREVDRKWWEWALCGATRRESVCEETRARVELDYTPSVEEIENIEREWSEGLKHEQDRFSDMGFKLRTGQILWLSHSLPKIELDLNVNYLGQDEMLVSGNELLCELQRNSDRIKAVLK